MRLAAHSGKNVRFRNPEIFCTTSDTRGENLRCCSQRLSEEEEELESGPELLLVELNRGVRPLERLLGTEWRDERMGDGP